MGEKKLPLGGTTLLGSGGFAFWIAYDFLNGSSRSLFDCGLPELITDSGNSFAPLSTGNPAVAQSSTVSTTALEVAGTVVMVATGEISSSSNDLGSSSDDPDSIIEIRVDNDLAYGVVEERAKAVYDKYDKNHQPTIDVGASLVAETPEVRELLDQIFNTMPSKDILDGLSVMQRVYKSKPKKRN